MPVMKEILVHLGKMLVAAVLCIFIFMTIVIATDSGDDWYVWAARIFIGLVFLSTLVSGADWLSKRGL